jgi:hypothetical protein
MSQNIMTHPTIARPACDRATRVTKTLLGYGVLAGPFYVLVVLGQALLRPGFSLVHDDASLLSNGSFGWVQILNFVLTGSMVIAFAVGVARALGQGRGATWGPRLLGVFGLGLIAACFVIAARCWSTGQRRWAASSQITGIVFLAGFFGVASGSGSALVVIGFWVALLVAWAWIASLAMYLYRRPAGPARPA